MKFKNAKRTNFVEGDKVKILPSSIADGVSCKAHNQVGYIIKKNHPAFPQYCTVKMEKPELNNGKSDWAVSPCNISLIVKGQQLLFSFME